MTRGSVEQNSSSSDADMSSIINRSYGLSDVLVHDWIEKNGGAEKVLDSLVDAFPAARVLTLWNDAPGRYRSGKVIESPLARTPLRGRKALSAPMQTLMWRGAMLGRGEIDRIIVSSHLFAHHIGKATLGATIPKFVYVHTPARYIWEPDLDARGNHPIVRAASTLLRPLDRFRASEATSLAANSEFVRNRIQRCWGVDAQVIHPPVATNRVQSQKDWLNVVDDTEAEVLQKLPTEFLLGASRFVEYKRLDLVIKAGEIADMPVVLAGAGPDLDRLLHIAKEATVPVTFIQNPSDAALYALYQKARAYIFPAVEDFGIMPVEAMAAGCPVLCNVAGGAGESVMLANIGERADFTDVTDIKFKLERLLKSGERVDSALMNVFAPERFQERVRTWVEAG